MGGEIEERERDDEEEEWWCHKQLIFQFGNHYSSSKEKIPSPEIFNVSDSIACDGEDSAADSPADTSDGFSPSFVLDVLSIINYTYYYLHSYILIHKICNYQYKDLQDYLF